MRAAERPHFRAEGLVFGRVGEVHCSLPILPRFAGGGAREAVEGVARRPPPPPRPPGGGAAAPPSVCAAVAPHPPPPQSGGGCFSYSRSTIVTFARPPPSHMVCRP